MQQLRKASGKDGYLALHERLDYHKDALLQGNAASNSIDNHTCILQYTLSVMNKEMYDKNMKILKFIVRTIIFCGKQNIALRGHRDDNTSTTTNQGNFHALIHHLAESNAELHEHLESGKRNAQLTSKTVQNEIIGVIGEYIRKEVTKPLQLPSAVYTIIADEVTDEYSNKEIMSLCLRFMDSGKIKEIFLDFVALE